MTPSDKNEYKLKWHRFQQRYEKIYTAKFKAALLIQLRQYIKGGTVFYITSEPIYKVLKELYETVGPLWAARTGVHKFKKIERKDRMPMGFSERIVELMKQYYGLDILNEAELITTYTREVIVKVLSEAAQSGASFDQIVKELTNSTELGAMRARRISRTEVVSASNAASVINAKESGLKMKKEWIAILDSRTRHNHRDVDGVTINIDDPFNVGGELMMQPGVREQTNGLPTSAANVINCRCTTGFIAQRDRRGQLIRS